MTFAGFRRRLETARIDPDMLKTCLAVTDVLSKIAAGDGYHLSLPFFAKQLGEAHQARLLPALGILCTMDDPPLAMNGYLDVEDGQHHLSDEEFHTLLQSSVLVHPDSGERIDKPLEHVRVYYSVRDEVRDES